MSDARSRPRGRSGEVRAGQGPLETREPLREISVEGGWGWLASGHQADTANISDGYMIDTPFGQYRLAEESVSQCS